MCKLKAEPQLHPLECRSCRYIGPGTIPPYHACRHPESTLYYVHPLKDFCSNYTARKAKQKENKPHG